MRKIIVDLVENQADYYFFLESFFKKYHNKITVSKKKNYLKITKPLTHEILHPSDFRKNKYTVEKQLINCSMRRGLFLKAKSILKTSYYTLYQLLLHNNPILLKKKFSFFETLGQIILHNNYWFCFNNMLTYFLKKIKPIFALKCVSILKKFKRKKKILKIDPYRYFLHKVPVHKRLTFAIREFHLHIQSIKRQKADDRVFLAMLDLFLLDKNSFLYRKKIKCYRQVFRKYMNIGRVIL